MASEQGAVTPTATQAHGDKLFRKLNADCLEAHSTFLAELPFTPEDHGRKSTAGTHADFHHDSWASGPLRQRKKIVREYFVAQFEACCRSFWEILAYRDGEAHYENLLEDLIRQVEPRIAEFQRFLGPGFDDEVRLLLNSRKSHYLAAASRAMVEAATAEEAKTPEGEPLPAAEATKRRKMVDSYIEEVRRQTGRQITRTEIWKSLKYKSRTEFERWERNDPKNPNKTAHDRFVRFFKEKPHLKTDKPRVN